LLKELDGELNAADSYISELRPDAPLRRTDHLNAIMTISRSRRNGIAGLGFILLRMYLRWAERKGMSAEVLDETPGEEAAQVGNDSISPAKMPMACWLERPASTVSSDFSVRSGRAAPQSFASVFVIPEIDDRIEINIRPEDLRVELSVREAKAANVNKVETAVRITHLPPICGGLPAQRSQARSRNGHEELRSRLYDEK